MNEGLIYGSCDTFHQTIFNSRTQSVREWKVYEFTEMWRISTLALFCEKGRKSGLFCYEKTLQQWIIGSSFTCLHPHILVQFAEFIQSTFFWWFCVHRRNSPVSCILLFHVRFSTFVYEELKIIIATKNSISWRKKNKFFIVFASELRSGQREISIMLEWGEKIS